MPQVQCPYGFGYCRRYRQLSLQRAFRDRYRRLGLVCHQDLMRRKSHRIPLPTCGHCMREGLRQVHRFDHQSHLTQSGERSDQLCLSCHAADSSSLSEDILMPEQDNCLQCHDTHSSSSVQLECVDCHSYHLKADHQQVFLHSSDL